MSERVFTPQVQYEVQHYPFRMDDDRSIIRPAIFGQIDQLLEMHSFTPGQRSELRDWIVYHFEGAERMFKPEEEARAAGKPGANLTYHGIPHALDQITYDAAAVLQAVSQPENRLHRYVTPEVIAATLVGDIIHDEGYVWGEDIEDPSEIVNHAQRIGIHVEQSMKLFSGKLANNPPPGFISTELTERFGLIAIHATNFPFDECRLEEQKMMLEAFHKRHTHDPNTTQALLAANISRFVDLGGQVARVDRFPDGLRALRAEYNGEQPGKGDEIIGLDHEMSKKCRAFVDAVVEPQMGQIGYLLFGTTEHSFSRDWRNIPTDWLPN